MGGQGRRIKAELKRAGIGYLELAERLNEHGLQEFEELISGNFMRDVLGDVFRRAPTVLGIEKL